jgi:hypothetical protein
MKATEQLEIVEVGLTSIQPGDDVIDIAPLGRPPTTAVLAVAITGDHRPSQIGRDHPGFASQLER